jgi:hypothetical protein
MILSIVRKMPLCLALLGLSLLAGVTNVKADSVNFDLTDGTNTMTWTLPASPTPTGVSTGSFFAVGPTAVLENGTTTVTQPLQFYTIADGGGASNSPESPLTLFDLFGAQVFSGTLNAPTFVPGDYEFSGGANRWVLSDATDFDLKISPVPEPASILLLGAGLLGLVGMGLRRKRLA